MSFKKLMSWMAFFYLMAGQCYATLTVPMSLVDAGGHGMSIGTIKVDDTIYGLLLTPQLHDIPGGFHGFHLHTRGTCADYAMAAGGHYDPEGTYEHRGPYRGNGHMGDLPVLIVNIHGRATLPVLAPRLRLSQVKGRSLVIVAGGDNYSERPLKQPGANIRIACGVIPYFD